MWAGAIVNHVAWWTHRGTDAIPVSVVPVTGHGVLPLKSELVHHQPAWITCHAGQAPVAKNGCAINTPLNRTPSMTRCGCGGVAVRDDRVTKRNPTGGMWAPRHFTDGARHRVDDAPRRPVRPQDMGTPSVCGWCSVGYGCGVDVRTPGRRSDSPRREAVHGLWCPPCTTNSAHLWGRCGRTPCREAPHGHH